MGSWRRPVVTGCASSRTPPRPTARRGAAGRSGRSAPPAGFARALAAEGIPVFGGYVPLNRNGAVIDEIHRLGGREPDPCPKAERAAADEVMVFSLPILMGTSADLADVATAVHKVARAR